MKDKLPLTLPEEQRDGEVERGERGEEHDADAAQQPAMRDQRIARTQRIVEICRWPGAYGSRHGRSAEAQLVGGFERCAADAADHGGAIAAGEWIVDGPRAFGTPESCGSRVARLGLLCFGHLVSA
jgi:hypothetical protein